MVRAHQSPHGGTVVEDAPSARSSSAVDMAQMADRAAKAAEFLKSLAHEDRLMVLCALSQGEMSVSELERTLGLQQANVSQHLARLRLGGLVVRRNDGAAAYYSLNGSEVRTILRALYQAFCAERVIRPRPNGKARSRRAT